MKNHSVKFKNSKTSRFYLKLIFNQAILTFLFLHSTNAASPQFLVSWQADSYAPSWYPGKIFPTKGSKINISFELINNGKIADLSKTKIRWYINDKLFKNEENGLGIKFLTFIIPDYPGQETEIRISIVDYKGQPLDKIIKIPVNAPEAIIEAAYPNRQINTGANVFLAYPFFFNLKNLKDLAFAWTINNQPALEGEKSEQLNLNIDPQTPKGFEMNIQATIRNLLNQMEFASKNIKMVIK